MRFTYVHTFTIREDKFSLASLKSAIAQCAEDIERRLMLEQPHDLVKDDFTTNNADTLYFKMEINGIEYLFNWYFEENRRLNIIEASVAYDTIEIPNPGSAPHYTTPEK